MAYDYNSLFEGIKSSLNGPTPKENARATYERILKFSRPKAGDPPIEYLFRLLPYIKEGKEGIRKTFYHFIKYYWQDDLGQYQTVLSRRTFNEPCIITNYYFNTLNNGSKYEKERLEYLRYKEGWYCNVYVVNDPIKPENNGKVMIAPLAKGVWKIVQEAINGALDEEWSARATDANPDGREVHVSVGKMVTDLSNSGVNLCLKVRNKGGFADYASSEFTRRGAKLNLSEDQQESILQSCIDPASLDREMSADEIAKKFKESFLHMRVDQPQEKPAPVRQSVQQPVKVEEEEDNIPGIEPHPSPKPQASPSKVSSPSPDTEGDMDAFIKGLSPDNDFDFS